MQYVKQTANGKGLCNTGSSARYSGTAWKGRRGWSGEGEVQEGDIYILWLIHAVIWKKPIQYYKTIILQLKTIKKKHLCVVRERKSIKYLAGEK